MPVNGREILEAAFLSSSYVKDSDLRAKSGFKTNKTFYAFKSV